MTIQLQGKVALITGASRGIGRAVAERFAAAGARLAICARNEEDLERAAEEIRSQTRADVLAVKANVARLNDVHRFVGAAAKKFSRIDILVNNAGEAHAGGILAVDDETWEYHLQLKLLGAVRSAREVIPHMRASGGGRIINVAGMAGKEPRPLSMVTGVTSAALLNFTKSLALELEPDRITVNAVNPGSAGTDAPDAAGPVATPDEIASAVLYLASDAAACINGISLNVDRGHSSGLW
jgi:NAD(P)-dependent dehydrogenase (short-subunit alcohol dehydrogenase family)